MYNGLQAVRRLLMFQTWSILWWWVCC